MGQGKGKKMEKQKVVIIGAGPAGLTAANELLKYKDEYEVIILEESDQIGGISRTVKHKGNRMDIGGHRFFSKDQLVMNLWEDLMPIQGMPTYDDKLLGRESNLKIGGPNPEEEDTVMLIRHRISRIYSLKKFFDYPVSMSKNTLKNMGFIRTIKAGVSYLKAVIFKRKEKSLEDFFINRFGKVLYSMFFEKYTEKLWGRHPSDISPDWGAQRAKGLSIRAVLKDAFSKLFKKEQKEVETSLIEEFWYPKYGPGQLWETLAQRIESEGIEIKKEYSVKNIKLENNKITSVLCLTKDGIEEIKGDIFISTMPVKDLVLGINGQVVPEEIKEIAKGLPYRDFITAGILLDKLALENKTDIKTIGDIVPDCWIYVQEPDVKMCRIQIFNNWSPYLVEKPEENVWIGLEYVCQEADNLWSMTENEFKDFAVEELMSMNIIKKDNVKDVHIEKIKKAYPAYFDTYKQMDEIIEYLDKINNIYCIGRNGQHRYNNMDHSMITAIEAVNNIHNNIEDKSNIWNVNTEKNYHETKQNDEYI